MLAQLIDRMMKDQDLCKHLGYDPAVWRVKLNPRGFSPDPVIFANLDKLGHRLFVIEQAFGIPVMNKVSSGLRNRSLQASIDKAAGREPLVGSKHLTGQAADILDLNHNLYAAITDEPELLELLDVYLEHKDYTRNWCHIQIVPPKSKKRIFIPY